MAREGRLRGVIGYLLYRRRADPSASPAREPTTKPSDRDSLTSRRAPGSKPATTSFFTGLAAGIALLAAGEAPAADLGRLSLATGYDWSRGDFGSARDTEVHYGTLAIGYGTPELSWTPGVNDWFEFRGTLPYLQIDGPGVVTRGRPERDRSDGIGDALLRASYGIQPDGAAPFLEFSGQWKFPTADEDDGLGTGEHDASFEFALYPRWGDTAPFASVGYRFVGDPPGIDLNDRWQASVGVSQRLSGSLRAGLLYDFREAIGDGADDAHELVLFGSWRWGPRLRFAPYGVLGLSDGSPDFALGAQLRVDIELR